MKWLNFQIFPFWWLMMLHVVLRFPNYQLKCGGPTTAMIINTACKLELAMQIALLYKLCMLFSPHLLPLRHPKHFPKTGICSSTDIKKTNKQRNKKSLYPQTFLWISSSPCCSNWNVILTMMLPTSVFSNSGWFSFHWSFQDYYIYFLPMWFAYLHRRSIEKEF